MIPLAHPGSTQCTVVTSASFRVRPRPPRALCPLRIRYTCLIHVVAAAFPANMGRDRVQPENNPSRASASPKYACVAPRLRLGIHKPASCCKFIWARDNIRRGRSCCFNIGSVLLTQRNSSSSWSRKPKTRPWASRREIGSVSEMPQCIVHVHAVSGATKDSRGGIEYHIPGCRA